MHVAYKYYKSVVPFCLAIFFRLIPYARRNLICVKGAAFAMTLAAPIRQRKPSDLFGFDTCADVSVVNDVSLLRDVEPVIGVSIQGVSGVGFVTHIGTLNLDVSLGGGDFWTITLENVLVLPSSENILCASDVLAASEVSCCQLQNNFDGRSPHLILNDKRIVPIIVDGNRYFIRGKVNLKRKQNGNNNTVRAYPAVRMKCSVLNSLTRF